MDEWQATKQRWQIRTHDFLGNRQAMVAKKGQIQGRSWHHDVVYEGHKARQKRQDLNEWRGRDRPLSGAFDRLYTRLLCFGGEAETQETVKGEQGREAKLA